MLRACSAPSAAAEPNVMRRLRPPTRYCTTHAAQDLAAGPHAQAEAEARQLVVPFDMIGLTGGQGERGHGLGGELHESSGKRWESSRPDISGRCWHYR